MNTPHQQTLQRGKETTVRDFLNVVFRRKWIIVSMVILTTLAVLFLKTSQPQTFVSNARILVKRGEQSNVYAQRPTILTWTEEVSSQIEIILSENVFSKARQYFADSLAARGNLDHLAFNPGSVRADVVGESNVFIISYSGYDPTECVLGAAAMTEAYKEYYRERAAPPAVSDYFLTEIQQALEELQSWRQRKSEFLTRERYMGIDEENDLHSFKLARLEIQLADAENKLVEARGKRDKLAPVVQYTPEELEQNLAVSTNVSGLQSAIMRNIKEALQRIRLERESLLQRYTPRHPEVVALDEQIKNLQIELWNEVENAYEVSIGDYDQAVNKYRTVERQVAVTKDAINAIPHKEIELGRIENKLASIQAHYDMLIEKQSEAAISVASSPQWDVTVLAYPTRAWPQKTADYVRLALGPFLALIVGLGVAFFFESLDHSLKNVAEVEEYLGKPVLATFSEVQRKK